MVGDLSALGTEDGGVLERSHKKRIIGRLTSYVRMGNYDSKQNNDDD